MSRQSGTSRGEHGGAVGSSLTDVKPSLQPEELPEEEEVPMEMDFKLPVQPLFDRLPFRDSFNSRTEYISQDAAAAPNGLTHEILFRTNTCFVFPGWFWSTSPEVSKWNPRKVWCPGVLDPQVLGHTWAS